MARFGLVQVARAIALNRGNLMGARAYLAQRHGPHSEVVEFVSRGITDTTVIDNPDDAALRALGSDFVGLVAKQSIIGRIAAASGFHRVMPFVSMLTQSTGATATWVGEGEPVLPVSDEGFVIERMGVCKLGALLAATDEFMRALGEQPDSILNRDLARAVSDASSATFASSNAGSDGAKPAGVFYGITPIASTGDAAQDFAALFDSYPGDLTRAVILTTPSIAVSLALSNFTDTLGATGGYVAGVACVTSDAVPAGTIGLIDPSRIGLVDLGVGVDASNQALIEVDDGSGSTKLVSLWQENLHGLRAVAYQNWRVLASDTVRLVTGYGQGTAAVNE